MAYLGTKEAGILCTKSVVTTGEVVVCVTTVTMTVGDKKKGVWKDLWDKNGTRTGHWARERARKRATNGETPLRWQRWRKRWFARAKGRRLRFAYENRLNDRVAIRRVRRVEIHLQLHRRRRRRRQRYRRDASPRPPRSPRPPSHHTSSSNYSGRAGRYSRARYPAVHRRRGRSRSHDGTPVERG